MPIDDKREGTTAGDNVSSVIPVETAPKKHHSPISKLWNSLGRPVEEPGVYNNSHWDTSMQTQTEGSKDGASRGGSHGVGNGGAI
jgi:hypothetical protein